MGIIIVSLLVAVISSILMFVGTFAILAVSPAELWESPIAILESVGEMEAGTAQLHVALLLTTLLLLILLALAVLIVNLVKKGEYKHKELLENIFAATFYVVFLVFLGNGIFYVYHLFINLNTLF